MSAIPINTHPLAGWGAPVNEWSHFDIILGLTRDLLPVVSNRNAIVSTNSSLRDVGKVPSLYNNDKHAVGIAKWTQRVTTGRDIDMWSKQRDYGICLQTRYVRGFDVDVPDETEASDIRAFVQDWIQKNHGITLPVRSRSNSTKFLMPFVMIPDDFSAFPKRTVKTSTGVIEILGDGQQFIAVGTHPSGVRYEWSDGLPDRIPVLEESDFEALWAAVVSVFGTEAVIQTSAARTLTAPRAGFRPDAMYEYLAEQGMVLGVDGSGRVAITCPFEEEHSQSEGGGAGGTSTVYFPAGTGGYAQGHFHCLHSHCAHRDDDEFIAAVGYIASLFDVLPALTEDEKQTEAAMPRLQRDKNGEPLALLNNVLDAVAYAPLVGVRVGRDTFKDAAMLTRDMTGYGGWREFTDTDYTALRSRLEKDARFKPIGREMMRDVVALVAERLQFDSAQMRLAKLTWDGVPRVAAFLSAYMQADDTPYTQAVSLYMWTGLAGRTLQPGVKADMVPVLIGGQGIQKSTCVAAMAFSSDEFVEMDLATKDDDIARMLRGVTVVELAELKGLGAKEQEHVKALITKTADKWIPKFMECSHTNARRGLFIGTSNRTDFLTDSTGNRRWLPVEVRQGDATGVARDREQLWAEAAVLFNANGVMWAEAEKLAVAVHKNHMVQDAWEGPIKDWLDQVDELDVPQWQRPFRTDWLLAGALGVTTGNAGPGATKRIGDILRNLQFVAGSIKDKTTNTTVYRWVFSPKG